LNESPSLTHVEQSYM